MESFLTWLSFDCGITKITNDTDRAVQSEIRAVTRLVWKSRKTPPHQNGAGVPSCEWSHTDNG